MVFVAVVKGSGNGNAGGGNEKGQPQESSFIITENLTALATKRTQPLHPTFPKPDLNPRVLMDPTERHHGSPKVPLQSSVSSKSTGYYLYRYLCRGMVLEDTSRWSGAAAIKPGNLSALRSNTLTPFSPPPAAKHSRWPPAEDGTGPR